MSTTKSKTKYNFVPFENLLAKKMKHPTFRKAFSEEMSRLQLAHQIKTLRQKKKMTQHDVAKKADMPQSVIARLESGKHSFSIATLHKIAQVFNKQVGLVG